MKELIPFIDSRGEHWLRVQQCGECLQIRSQIQPNMVVVFGAYDNLSSRQMEVAPGKGVKYMRPVSDKLLWGVSTTIKIVGEFYSATLLGEVTKVTAVFHGGL